MVQGPQRILTQDELDAVLSGSNVKRTEVQRVKEVTQWLLAEAAEARHDVKKFFSFVMREEHTGRSVRCMPHQRVLFDFIRDHPMCVIRMPVGASKTFSMAAQTLHMLGEDPNQRGSVVSATQGQASKPVTMCRDLIDSNVRLRLVFPKLKKSRRRADPWTGHRLTVDRPAGIRDPSLVAVGLDGALAGARLSWVIIDDVLTRENTYTPQARTKVHEWLDSTVFSRLDPKTARAVVTNTSWHPDDVTYRLEASGYPTLSMDIEGGIWITNSDEWDTDDIRPAYKHPGDYHRLTAHDDPAYAVHAQQELSLEEVRALREELNLVQVAEPVIYSFLKQKGIQEVPVPETDIWVDEQEVVPLWPERFDRMHIEEMRSTHLPHRFNQLFMSVCRDDATARCKSEWIEQCKEPGMTMVSRYDGDELTVTGVDLAVGKGMRADYSAFFTFAQQADGYRRILDVEFGQMDAPEIVNKVIEKAQLYKSIVRVENNAAQDYIVQFARAQNRSVPVKAHATGRAKAHPEYGVESLFVELQNGAWIIPCDKHRRCNPAIQRWIDECLYFTPGAHTGDVLMACWLAQQQARAFGAMAFNPHRQANREKKLGPPIGIQVMAR